MQGARNEIFAMQPAPIQVSYMGFPGTTGATYIDYLVTDEVCNWTRVFQISLEHLFFPSNLIFLYVMTGYSLLPFSSCLLCNMHTFTQRSWSIFPIATLSMITSRYAQRKVIFTMLFVHFHQFHGLIIKLICINAICRKIRMCWIQILSPSDQTMDFPKTNSYLHASTNCTKWILRSLILGKCFS